jgi:hypothetical protein
MTTAAPTPAERLLHADICAIRAAFAVIESDPAAPLTPDEARKVLDAASRIAPLFRQDAGSLTAEQIDVIRDVGAAFGIPALRALVRIAERAVGGSQPKMH